MKGSWFKFNNSYSDDKGVELELWGNGGVSRKLNLTKNDVSYLLESIDGHVTAGPNPVSHIIFPLYGLLVRVSDREWLEFTDALGEVAGQGGWQPQFIA